MARNKFYVRQEVLSEKKGLRRPYVRDSVRAEVENRAEKTPDGKFKSPNTGKVIEGKYDLGHKYGHEHWREKEQAEKEGLTQEEFNERMNNPDIYQIEPPDENRSRKYEKPREETTEQVSEQNTEQNSEQNSEQASDQASSEEVMQEASAEQGM
ncbi:MAG: HNH/ENDO VII family nuclease [Defluviitaleaceae bacterium]|nr:HNH/ENDO VII family nuclease [Defluviitaleaceae bacterium]